MKQIVIVLRNNMLKDPNYLHPQRARYLENINDFKELNSKCKLVNMPAHHILPAGEKDSIVFAKLFEKHGITDFDVNGSRNGVIIPKSLNTKANDIKYFNKVQGVLRDKLSGKTGTEAKQALNQALVDISNQLDNDRILFKQGKSTKFINW